MTSKSDRLAVRWRVLLPLFLSVAFSDMLKTIADDLQRSHCSSYFTYFFLFFLRHTFWFVADFGLGIRDVVACGLTHITFIVRDEFFIVWTFYVLRAGMVLIDRPSSTPTTTSCKCGARLSTEELHRDDNRRPVSCTEGLLAALVSLVALVYTTIAGAIIGCFVESWGAQSDDVDANHPIPGAWSKMSDDARNIVIPFTPLVIRRFLFTSDSKGVQPVATVTRPVQFVVSPTQISMRGTDYTGALVKSPTSAPMISKALPDYGISSSSEDSDLESVSSKGPFPCRSAYETCGGRFSVDRKEIDARIRRQLRTPKTIPDGNSQAIIQTRKVASTGSTVVAHPDYITFPVPSNLKFDKPVPDEFFGSPGSKSSSLFKVPQSQTRLRTAELPDRRFRRKVPKLKTAEEVDRVLEAAREVRRLAKGIVDVASLTSSYPHLDTLFVETSSTPENELAHQRRDLSTIPPKLVAGVGPVASTGIVQSLDVISGAGSLAGYGGSLQCPSTVRTVSGGGLLDCVNEDNAEMEMDLGLSGIVLSETVIRSNVPRLTTRRRQVKLLRRQTPVKLRRRDGRTANPKWPCRRRRLKAMVVMVHKDKLENSWNIAKFSRHKKTRRQDLARKLKIANVASQALLAQLLQPHNESTLLHSNLPTAVNTVASSHAPEGPLPVIAAAVSLNTPSIDFLAEIESFLLKNPIELSSHDPWANLYATFTNEATLQGELAPFTQELDLADVFGASTNTAFESPTSVSTSVSYANIPEPRDQDPDPVIPAISVELQRLYLAVSSTTTLFIPPSEALSTSMENKEVCTAMTSGLLDSSASLAALAIGHSSTSPSSVVELSNGALIDVSPRPVHQPMLLNCPSDRTREYGSTLEVRDPNTADSKHRGELKMAEVTTISQAPQSATQTAIASQSTSGADVPMTKAMSTAPLSMSLPLNADASKSAPAKIQRSALWRQSVKALNRGFNRNEEKTVDDDEEAELAEFLASRKPLVVPKVSKALTSLVSSPIPVPVVSPIETSRQSPASGHIGLSLTPKAEDPPTADAVGPRHVRALPKRAMPTSYGICSLSGVQDTVVSMATATLNATIPSAGPTFSFDFGRAAQIETNNPTTPSAGDVVSAALTNAFEEIHLQDRSRARQLKHLKGRLRSRR